jgi:hypothetical protein
MVTNGPFVPFGPASGDDPSSNTGPPERPLPPWDPAAPIGDPGEDLVGAAGSDLVRDLHGRLRMRVRLL